MRSMCPSVTQVGILLYFLLLFYFVSSQTISDSRAEKTQNEIEHSGQQLCIRLLSQYILIVICGKIMYLGFFFKILVNFKNLIFGDFLWPHRFPTVSCKMPSLPSETDNLDIVTVSSMVLSLHSRSF